MKSDVFSLGITLFIMVMGHPPFRKAVRNDRHYLPIYLSKFNVFWRNALCGKPNPKNYISQDLIELITAML
jgi:serine/threonine protein kinase